MKNKLIKNLIVCVLCLWVIIFATIKWLSADEPLSKESQALLDQVQMYDPDLQEHPYFFELGFDARNDADQILLGQLQYHSDWSNFIQHQLGEEGKNNNQDLEKFRGQFFSQKSIDMFKAMQAVVKEQGLSYQLYSQNRAELQRLYASQGMLNARFQRLLNAPQSDKVLLLTAQAKIPDFILIIRMHHLYLSHLAFKNDISGIVKYIEKLEQMNTHVPLIDKMIQLSMLSDSLNILNDLNRKTPKVQFQIPRLTPPQLSVRYNFADEIARTESILVKFNDDQVFAKNIDHIFENKNSSSIKLWLYYSFVHLFFLKNTSLNSYAEPISSFVSLSEMENNQFKQAIQKDLNIQQNRAPFKNYLGYKIVDVAMPAWKSYVVSPRFVNQKIQILNVLVQNRQFDLKQLNQNKEGYEYYRTATELCIKSPDPQTKEEDWKRYKSCLKI